MRLGSKASTETEFLQQQAGLNKLIDWPHKWRINFNIGKCKVLHVGSKSEKKKEIMNSVDLQNVSEEQT